MTDKELAAELKSYGFDGPVVATTRAVYERKLATFRAEVGGVCVCVCVLPTPLPAVNYEECTCCLQDAKSSKGTRSKEEVDVGELSDDSGSDQSSIGEDTPEPGRKEASVPLVAQYIVTPPRQHASQHREGQHASQRLPKVESGSRQRAHQPLTVSQVCTVHGVCSCTAQQVASVVLAGSGEEGKACSLPLPSTVPWPFPPRVVQLSRAGGPYHCGPPVDGARPHLRPHWTGPPRQDRRPTHISKVVSTQKLSVNCSRTSCYIQVAPATVGHSSNCMQDALINHEKLSV